LKKAIYPRQWYERLKKFLISQNYERGKVDKTLFIGTFYNDIILAQIYRDKIIFGATNGCFCEEFVLVM